MFTVTFYSYKGGVGRTSALMNVAHRLCEQGKTACILDFDLEAPGLDAYQVKTLAEPNKGVVEYVTDSLAGNFAPSLHDYVVDITPADSTGKLMLITAGMKDEAYQYSLSRLDWKILYGEKHGYLIVEALRRSIANELRADYLLIDSRTGLTDVSGICTLQLPDLVVFIFNLNAQNVQGTAKVYKTVIDNRLNRSIETVLVASPIPDVPDSLEIRSGRFEVARKAIGASPDLILPYDPFMSFQESIIADEQSRALSTGYRELTNLVVAKNAKDIVTLLRGAAELRESGDMELAELRYQDILEMYPQSGEAWFEYGVLARITGRLQVAVEAFTKATGLNETRGRAYPELILTYLQIGDTDRAHLMFETMLASQDGPSHFARLASFLADRGMFAEALLAVDKAVLSSEDFVGMTGWTRAQSLAGLKRYAEAFEEYDRRRQIAPTMLAAVFNAGAMAAFAGKPEARSLLTKAIELFEGIADKRASTRDMANIYSAIAFAYQYLEEEQKAAQALSDALTLARRSVKGRLFLFPEYKYVSQEDFISAITERLEILKLKLPSSSAEEG
jgi:tetratricopeptide (TPR) repeat protein/MinD-like ATPase involved in chromosome partitioning or flagellar assembly